VFGNGGFERIRHVDISAYARIVHAVHGGERRFAFVIRLGRLLFIGICVRIDVAPRFYVSEFTFKVLVVFVAV